MHESYLQCENLFANLEYTVQNQHQGGAAGKHAIPVCLMVCEHEKGTDRGSDCGQNLHAGEPTDR